MTEISEKEVLRYLGYRGAKADERVLEDIRRLAAELEASASPRSAYGIWDCRVEPASVTLGGLTIASGGLARHLKGCRRAALLAATLGAGADRLIRRYAVDEMELAVIADAVCTEMIEKYCDKIGEDISRSPEVAGLYPTARFSPGYGDFDILHQKNILRLLDRGKKLGLSMTGGMMLAPSKSVTAVIGFRGENTAAGGKCENCEDTQCAVRECGCPLE